MAAAGASRSLALGLRDQLRATVVAGGLALSESECEVMGDGRPAPDCGTWFYAIHDVERINRLLTGDESEFGAIITITRRCNAPFDRVGRNEVEAIHGLNDKADAVWDNIFDRQWGVAPTLGVMNRANSYLTSLSGATVNQWIEAIYPTNKSKPQPVREDWFNAVGQTQQAKHGQSGHYQNQQVAPFVGFTSVIRFSGAKLIKGLVYIG